MYNIEEIKAANKTARSKGSSVFDSEGKLRSLVANYVIDNVPKDYKILDFGSGPQAIQASYLRKIGFEVDAYDFGDNIPENGVNEIKPIYDCIYASNVLNVSTSLDMLISTIREIRSGLKRGGMIVVNYPSSPRKTMLNAKDIKSILGTMFKTEPVRVAGTSSAPVWVIKTNLD